MRAIGYLLIREMKYIGYFKFSPLSERRVLQYEDRATPVPLVLYLVQKPTKEIGIMGAAHWPRLGQHGKGEGGDPQGAICTEFTHQCQGNAGRYATVAHYSAEHGAGGERQEKLSGKAKSPKRAEGKVVGYAQGEG